MTDHNDTGATARPWREALRREPERYAACSPEAISHGSQAQMKYFVADAQHDIAILATRLAEVERERDEARAALGRIAQPDDLAADPSNFGAFAEAYLNFAQYIARTALAAEQKEAGK